MSFLIYYIWNHSNSYRTSLVSWRIQLHIRHQCANTVYTKISPHGALITFVRTKTLEILGTLHSNYQLPHARNVSLQKQRIFSMSKTVTVTHIPQKCKKSPKSRFQTKIFLKTQKYFFINWMNFYEKSECFNQSIFKWVALNVELPDFHKLHFLKSVQEIWIIEKLKGL